MKNTKSGKRKNDVILDRTQVLSGRVDAPVIYDPWLRTKGIALIVATLLSLLFNIAWITSGFGQNGVIHLVTADNHLSFDIDAKLAAEDGLGISSKLLGLARTVRRPAETSR